MKPPVSFALEAYLRQLCVPWWRGPGESSFAAWRARTGRSFDAHSL
ncbi:hypothetical protein COLSTE_01871 [Collinsella stercoris DSM 13279]|uniref:Uncharacterized protein n=1 Tax=Collinsella stercoris DSM 13279 TaxID=445975 RepID=B6GCP6_9ACTN|nr:hypothetical protein COLSTE_01871 [Collinsella stercoris DSM 13279]